MRLRRFRIRTLMIAVAVVGIMLGILVLYWRSLFVEGPAWSSGPTIITPFGRIPSTR